MVNLTEFRDLNSKVRLGEATPAERARWEVLKEEVFRAREATRGQRRFERAPMSLEVTFEYESDLRRACSIEVGAGGLAVEADGAFAVGDTVVLAVSFPWATEPVTIRARVTWRRGRMAGFEFLDLDPALRDRIDALVWNRVDPQQP